MDAKKNTDTQSNTQQNPVTQPKKNYIRRQYFQGIICDLDTRESGKKRYFWTKIILVILIISIVLIIVSLTLLGNNNTNWWVYLIFGSLGVIGCAFGHYYNTKTYIENSKYDIDIDDIAAFIDIKNKIKDTIQKISTNKNDIDKLNRQINITIGKNKAKAFASSIASSTSKGLTQARQSIASSTAKGIENAKSGISSLADKSKSGISSLRNRMKPTNQPPAASDQSPMTNGQYPAASAANEFYVGGDDDQSVKDDQLVKDDPNTQSLETRLNKAKEDLEDNKKILDEQMKEYNKLKEKNDDYKEIKMANQHNKNIIYNISDFYSAKSLLDDIKSIDKNKLESLNLDETEQKIFNEYTQMMNDIKQIKSLNTNQDKMSIYDLKKIINIYNLNFKINYLKQLKINNLDKYIQSFLLDIELFFIDNPKNIEQYNEMRNLYREQIETNMSFINDTSPSILLLKTKFNKLDIDMENIYTDIAIKNINDKYNDIVKNNYLSDKYIEFRDLYTDYTNKYKLNHTKLKEEYDKIYNDLVTIYVEYVNSQINPDNTLGSYNTIELIKDFINRINDQKDPLYNKLLKFSNNSILPIAKSLDTLKNRILKPFVEKLTTLEKAKALAESSSNNFTLQGLTNTIKSKLK